MDSSIRNFRHHYYNCEQLVLKYKELFEQKHIIDVGSNVGFFSEAIAKHCNYKSLHLFEPSYELFDYSKRLLAENSNIHFNNYGLSNIEGMLTLYKCPGDNLGWNTFLKKRSPPAG